jgi:hypothetical protein
MFQETEGRSYTQISYGSRNQNPIGPGLVTQSRGELHRCPEQIVPLGDRFAGRQSDLDPECLIKATKPMDCALRLNERPCVP